MRYLFAGGICLVIFGIVFVVLGFKEKSVAVAASDTPEEISLKDLVARGADGNPNIILTDYVPCENYVYKQEHGRWSGAWVPIVTADSVQPNQGRGGKPDKVQALFFTINAQSDADLYRLCTQQKLHALVVNKIVSLGSQEKELLQQTYPGTDLSKCIIVQEGRKPAGKTKLVAMISGGAVGAALGIGLLGFGTYLWSRQRNEDRPAPSRRRRKRRDDDEDDDDEDD